MPDQSDRFLLPYIQPGQAQKEMLHNEALAMIDMLIGGAVEAVGTNAPPASPAPGQCWIIGTAPTGAWAGQAGALAGWTAGGWRFVAPRAGMALWSIADGCWVHRDATGWRIGAFPTLSVRVAGVQVLGAQRPAIVAPVAGTTQDAEARTAIGSILSALRAHGIIAT